MSLPNGCKVWLALGADLTAAPSSWTWTDISAFVLYDGGAGVTVEIGYPDGSDEASPTRITFLANNADGRWSPTNPAGAWFGQLDIDTPVRVTFNAGSGDVVRGIAYLADLPLTWTAGGKYKTVPVEALGILSRLDQADVLASYARRNALAVGLSASSRPVAYWPCEDASESTRIASAVAGQPDIVSFTGLAFAGDTAYGGSGPLPTLTALSSISIGVAPYERPSPEAWGVMMAIKIPARPAATQDLGFAIFTNTGTVRKWVPEISNATPSIVKLRGIDSAGAEVLADTGFAFNTVVDGSDREPFGEALALEVSAQQSGTDVEWFFRIWHGGSAPASTGTLAAATLGPVNQLATGTQPSLEGATIGHYGIYTNSDGPGLGVGTPAFFVAGGGLSDLTTTRFELQAALNGVPTGGSGSTTTRMGYTPTDTLLNILRECDRLERGLMWDAPDGTVSLRSRSDLVNQAVAMTVPYAQVRSMQPTSVVRDYVNRITVSRSGGSSATVDATGPLSPTNRGVVRARQTTVNALDDTNLRYYAQWDAALGTVQDYRYTVDLQFHGAASSQLSTWLSRGLGDRTQVTGPPSWLPPDTIDTYLRGYSEHITRFEYTATLRLMPYRPYLAWTVEGSGNTGRADTSGSRLLAAVTTSSTSAIVGTYGNPKDKTGVAVKWSTASVPYDLAIRAAERVTCTAVANNPSTFVAAGVAAHGDNATLAPALPAGLTVGDLLLCAVAIRSTTAVVSDVSGWTRLPMFGASENLALFARQYVAGDSAPSVAFLNGAAGDSTSAQTCAFRFLQPVVHNRAVRLINTAALNMGTPDLGIVRNGCVAIAMAWMPDDWTSVTSPSGFTEIGEPDTTLGSDQGFSWAYVIQTTATYIPTGTFTVTGGTSQASRSGLVALLGDCQTLTLTRNVNSISGGLAHPAGAEINLWRAGVVMRP